MQEGWTMKSKVVGGKNEIHMINQQKETCIFSEVKKNLYYLHAKVIPNCNVGNVSMYNAEVVQQGSSSDSQQPVMDINKHVYFGDINVNLDYMLKVRTKV